MHAKPVTHELLNADGTRTQFVAVPFMSLEEARAAGAQKVNDPKFINEKIQHALKKAGKPDAEGHSGRADI